MHCLDFVKREVWVFYTGRIVGEQEIIAKGKSAACKRTILDVWCGDPIYMDTPIALMRCVRDRSYLTLKA